MPKRKNFTGDLFAPEEGQDGNHKEERSDLQNPMDLTDPTDRSDTSDTSGSSTFADFPRPQNNTQDTHNTHQAPKVSDYKKTTSTSTPKETKSKRLNLLVRPGVLKEFAKIAHMQHTSVNDLLNRLMAEHNEKEASAIRQYDRLIKEKRAD